MSTFKVRKHKNGTYYFDLHHDRVGRKRKYGFQTKREATQHAITTINQLDNQTYNHDISFRDYCTQWIKSHKLHVVSDIQLKWYYRAIDNYTAKYGENKRLKDVTRNEIQALLNEYGKGKTKGSVKKLKNCLSAPLKDAVYDGYLSRDPTYDIKLNYTAASKTDDEKFISIEEYLELINFFKSKPLRSYLLLFILAITGARFSEVNNMTYQDLHYKPGKIWLPGTKTETSAREVSINRDDFMHIKNTVHFLPRKVNGKLFDISNTSALKVYRKGLRDINSDSQTTLYALRHTHASFLIAHQFDITYISKRLGHANPNTTLKVYSHLLQEQSDAQDEKLATIWRQSL